LDGWSHAGSGASELKTQPSLPKAVWDFSGIPPCNSVISSSS
jgi:hypothetical protein